MGVKVVSFTLDDGVGLGAGEFDLLSGGEDELGNRKEREWTADQGFAVKGKALDLCDGLGGCFGGGHADKGLPAHSDAGMGHDVEDGAVLLEEGLEGLLHHCGRSHVSLEQRRELWEELPSSLTFSFRLLTRTVWCGTGAATEGPASITVSNSIPVRSQGRGFDFSPFVRAHFGEIGRRFLARSTPLNALPLPRRSVQRSFGCSRADTKPYSVGSIGSLFATNLARLPAAQVRLIVRRKALAAALLDGLPSGASPLLSLSLERNGLIRKTDGFQLELTPALDDQDLALRSTTAGPPLQPKPYGNLVRNDPIDILIITTKAPSTLPAIRSLLPRLSASSTIVICQNGMGVLEGLLDRYWPDDDSHQPGLGGSSGTYGSGGGRPSFVCATTTHGVYKKGTNHFVHAGMGNIKFGVVPNRAVIASLVATTNPSWGNAYNNPLLNPRSLIEPTLAHIPLNSTTNSLHSTLSSLLQLELNTTWLPLPTLQITQLQKLALNASVNSLTAVMGVHNGALVGSKGAQAIINSISKECSQVFAAHLAREAGIWEPPPLPITTTSAFDSEEPISRTPPPPHPLPPPLPISHPLSAASLTDNTLRVIFRTSQNLSSTLQDILVTPGPPTAPSPTQVTRTEVDFINGYVIALGRRYGIETPVTESMGMLVKLKEEMLRSGAVDRVVETRRAQIDIPPPTNSTSIFRPASVATSSSTAGSLSSSPKKKRVPRPAYARARSQAELRSRRSTQRESEESERRGYR